MPEVTPIPGSTPSKAARFEIPAFADLVEAPETPEVKPEVVEVKEVTEVAATEGQDTGEQAPPAKPEAKPEKEEVTPDVAAKREGRRFERRLDKAYRLRAEAEARAKIAEERYAALQKPKPPEGEPKLEQFDFDPEKYAQAKADYAKSQAEKEFEAKQREESDKKSHQELISTWEEKVEKGVDKYDDWVEKAPELNPANPVHAAIMEADNGEDVLHYLTSHPKELKRISLKPVWSQIREIGKLEAKLASEPEKPKAPSKAPAPITPLTGTAVISSNEPSEQDDTATWIKKRQKQVHSR